MQTDLWKRRKVHYKWEGGSAMSLLAKLLGWKVWNQPLLQLLPEWRNLWSLSPWYIFLCSFILSYKPQFRRLNPFLVRIFFFCGFFPLTVLNSMQYSSICCTYTLLSVMFFIHGSQCFGKAKLHLTKRSMKLSRMKKIHTKMSKRNCKVKSCVEKHHTYCPISVLILSLKFRCTWACFPSSSVMWLQSFPHVFVELKRIIKGIFLT